LFGDDFVCNLINQSVTCQLCFLFLIEKVGTYDSRPITSQTRWHSLRMGVLI
jgi:hypothetical protein